MTNEQGTVVAKPAPRCADPRSPVRDRQDRERSVQWWRELFAMNGNGADVFTAPPTASAFARLYGGQIAAQSMLAASATVDDGNVPHSLRLVSARRDNAAAVTYRVDRIRDSRSMSTRVVTAEQSGRVLATSVVSFHQISVRAEHASEHEWPSPTAELIPPARIRTPCRHASSHSCTVTGTTSPAKLPPAGRLTFATSTGRRGVTRSPHPETGCGSNPLNSTMFRAPIRQRWPSRPTCRCSSQCSFPPE